jgi:Ca2+-dependent lipid-binding protein
VAGGGKLGHFLCSKTQVAATQHSLINNFNSSLPLGCIFRKIRPPPGAEEVRKREPKKEKNVIKKKENTSKENEKKKDKRSSEQAELKAKSCIWS